jgi:hypothetical protein
VETRDIVRLLRAHDEKLRRTPIGLATETRIQRRLREATAPMAARRSLWAALLVGAAVAGGAAAFVWSKVGPPAAAYPIERTAASASPPSDADACAVHQDEQRVDLSGRCTLKLASVTVWTEPGSELEAVQQGLRVLRGKARFEVEPVPTGARPVRVRVGGGIIEVVGTKFVVEQRDGGGSVDLTEGRIRFLGTGGPPVEIRPGEQFRWTNGAEPAADVSSSPAESASGGALRQAASPSTAPARGPTEPAAARRASQTTSDAGKAVADSRPAPSVSLQEAVRQAIRLREEGRYGDARRVLAELHSASLDPHAAEILSFEEGDLLEHFEQDAAICDHWKQHLTRFPDGQYRSVVSAKVSRLGCP